MAPTLGEACLFTPLPHRGPSAGLPVQALPRNWEEENQLPLPPLLPCPSLGTPRPPNPEAWELWAPCLFVPVGCEAGPGAPWAGVEGSCHVPFPGTWVKSHGPPLVTCPVHCVGLLEDQVRWQI